MRAGLSAVTDPVAYLIIAPEHHRHLVFTPEEVAALVAQAGGGCVVKELVLAETLVTIIQTLTGRCSAKPSSE